MKKHHAFTLIELLVVIAIISILATILIPSLKKAQQMARSVACISNQRAIILAAIAYQTDNNGRYPRNMGILETTNPTTGLWPNSLTRDWDGDRKATSYGEKLADYLGDSATYDHFVCPLVQINSDRLELLREYYENGKSAWLYTSYALYWDYALRPSSYSDHFIGPGAVTLGGEVNSTLLTSDLCVYSKPHNNRWFVSHPADNTANCTDYMYGVTWEIPWPDQNTLPPVTINAGRSDGSVSSVEASEIVPVSIEYSYQGSIFVGVPRWASN